MSPTLTKVQRLEQEFTTLFGNMTQAVQATGDKLVELVAADPDAINRLVTERGFNRNNLYLLVRVGEKKLLPKLAFVPGIAKLPLVDQLRLEAGPVDAVVIRNGQTDTIKVDIKTCISSMRQQLLAPDHLRTIPEQVQFVHTRTKTVVPAVQNGASWRVRCGKVDILQPIHGLTKSDLTNMIKAAGKKL